MRRIISLLCAAALTLAGAVLCYYEFFTPHEYSRVNGKLVAGALFMLGVGLTWLWSDLKEWK